MDWSLYEQALKVQGDTRRDRVIAQTKRIVKQRTPNSPGYKTVLIDGVEQDVVISSSTEMYHKKINALPDEHIYSGSIVEWNNHHYIITQTDTEDEIYQRGEMYKCNVYLKWQNEKGEIIGRYGFTEDISQFAAGTVAGKVMDSLQQVFKIAFPCDEETIKLRRDKRFLLDIDPTNPNAYILTNRNVVSGNYTVEDVSGDGTSKPPAFNGRDKVMYITLSETQLSEKDNLELMIADYFDPNTLKTPTAISGSCAIVYSGEPKIKIGGSGKWFTSEFRDTNGNIIPTMPVWSVTTMPGQEDRFTVTYDNNRIRLKVKAPDDIKLAGEQVKLTLTDAGGTCTSEIYVKVVGLYG